MKLLGVVAGIGAAIGVALPVQAMSYGDVRAAWLGNNATGRPVPAENGGVFRFARDNADPLDTFTGTLVDNKNIIVNNSVVNTFIGVCIEIGEYVSTTESTFEVRDLADAPIDSRSPMGAQRAADIAKLVELALDGYLGNALLPAYAARVLPFQVALWEIAHDRTNGPGSYNLALGDYQHGANATATGWLQQLNADLNTNLLARARSLFAMTNGGGTTQGDDRQDMLVQTPIPAAAWLLGSGLLGLFGIGRRRRIGTA